jgi:hypothetical protein
MGAGWRQARAARGGPFAPAPAAVKARLGAERFPAL